MKISILSICLALVMASDISYQTVSIDGRVKVKLPDSFFAMTPEDLAQRYPSVRRPIGAYTNMDRLVDFSVNESATRWRPEDINIAQSFFKATIMEYYDHVKWLNEGIVTVNKRDFIFFEFESRINGEKYTLGNDDSIKKYTYIMYLLINKKTIVFSFNAPLIQKRQWVDVANEIMNSVKVKNNI